MHHRFVFYNRETGHIYSVRAYRNHAAAENNCKRNPNRFKMTCKTESEVGYVPNVDLYKVDINQDPPVVVAKIPVPFDPVPQLRAQRNQKLFATDWTQAEDSPLSAEAKAQWATYRQALRDIDFDNFSGWPIPPA